VRQSPYSLEPNRQYSWTVPVEGAEDRRPETYGTVNVDTSTKKVVLYTYTKDEPEGKAMEFLEYDEWEDRLLQAGAVLTPMVERAGACLLVDMGEGASSKLGCLVQYPEHESQFNHQTQHYQAVVDAANTVTQVFFTDALRCLLPVGTLMYLKMDVIDDERFNQPARSSAGKWLLTRLNVPNTATPAQGKIYVSALYKKKRSRGQNGFVVSVTFPVNPWDVELKQLFSGPEDSIVKHLD
jgi:hypothetical protein